MNPRRLGDLRETGIKNQKREIAPVNDSPIFTPYSSLSGNNFFLKRFQSDIFINQLINLTP